MPAKKVDIELLKRVLQRNELDIRKVSQILEDIQVELEQEEEEPKPPPVKKQFCLLVSDPQEKLKDVDLVGWALQIPEEDSPHTATEKLIQAAYDFNATPKGSRMPIQSIAEACEHIPARILKEHQVWVKNKEPVLLVKTKNKIPTTTSTNLD